MKLTRVHVPAVIVQSYAPSGDPSDYAGHAAAAPSQRSSFTGRDDGTRGLGNPMGHVSSTTSTWCGPPGLIGSQILGESQIRGSSAAARHAHSLTKIDGNASRFLDFGPLLQTPIARRE